MLGWPRWPEGEGRLNPPDFVLLFCAFSKILSRLSLRELPAATYLAAGAGREDAVVGAAQGAPPHPLRSLAGTHARLGITYPEKEAWRGSGPCRSSLGEPPW